METAEVVVARLAVAEEARSAETVEVLEMVDAFFLAFTAKDETALESMLAGPGHVRSVRAGSDGEVRVSATAFADWPGRIAASESALVETYWNPVVNVRGDLMASVWAPYEIYIDGALSHCGIDQFTLVKQDGRWAMADLTYTTEPGACEELTAARRDVLRPAGLY